MALLFGSGDSVSFGGSALYKIEGDLTWAGWLKLNSSTTLDGMIANVELSAAETELSNSMLFFRVMGTNNSWDIQYIHEYGAGLNQANTFVTDIVNNVWIHIAVVRDVSAKTVKLYTDGTLFDTYNYTTDPSTTSSYCNYVLGQRTGGSDQFIGRMAHATLCNVAWTAEEVLSSAKGVHIRRGVVTYTPLYGDSSTAVDLSGNQKNGTVTGATKTDSPPVGRYVQAPKYRPQITITSTVNTKRSFIPAVIG